MKLFNLISNLNFEFIEKKEGKLISVKIYDFDIINNENGNLYFSSTFLSYLKQNF
jgi:hypothetical protein